MTIINNLIQILPITYSLIVNGDCFGETGHMKIEEISIVYVLGKTYEFL